MALKWNINHGAGQCESISCFVVSLYQWCIFLPETFKPAIMRKQAKEQGVCLAKSIKSPKEKLKAAITLTILQPLQKFLVELIVLFLSIYTAFVFAIMFSFF